MLPDLDNQHLMYSILPNTIIAFHGCDQSTYEEVLYHHKPLKPSTNEYDWLGNGIYFWENNIKRAWEWADAGSRSKYSSIRNPAVIGAVIDLGLCLDLVNSYHIMQLKTEYNLLLAKTTIAGAYMPKNTFTKSGRLLLRNLDCAVIEHLHTSRKLKGERPYDSVRGVFLEGDDIYKNAGFKEQTHIQLCIRNPNCIKGYFAPRLTDKNWHIL